ncbi:MAG: tetratricopeptide repeat protein [Gammaproteobacteria bacterium]|nr:tetratricopeptide repeat protein [Gammaproteobacteria bacterium]NHN37109.1 tetratricopeptide repeat protein [Pseudomaricurvus alcaniphilus]
MTTRLSKFVRQAFLVAPIVMAPAVSSVVLQSAGFSGLSAGSVFAADDEKKPTEYKTKKTYSLRQSVFKDFGAIQEKTEANDWKGALEELKDLERSKVDKYTSYERANVWNYYGWVYYSLENYPEAIRYYERLLKEEELSDALQLGTLYTLAQLLFVQEDYRGAVTRLEEWMSLQTIIGADAYVLLAQGYYQVGDMEKARKNVDFAVNDFESKDKVPKENWYSLQRAIYYEKGDNKKVIEILTKMVRHYPKPTYWKQLAGLYGATEQESNQLHAMETLYLMGELTNEKELLNLAYLFLGAEVPYKSARIIEKGMKDKIIEESSKNLEVLATAWRLAQHVKLAIPVMEKAAQKSDEGDLYARLAGIYLDTDQFEKALDVGEKAAKRGGVKRPDQLAIVMGMANVNLGKYDAAIKEFRKATKDKRSKQFAVQWIDFANNEKKRVASLKI